MPSFRPGLIAKFFLPDAICRLRVSGSKSAYLTFDDGPHPEVTPQILDILSRNNARATFFCVGANVEKYPDVYKRVLAEGHSVGNHTYSHVNGWKTSLENYLDDTEKCAKVVQSGLFRPPYGRITKKHYNQIRKKYRVMLWDVLSCDYDPNFTVEKCLGIVKRKTRDGSIIVFHDSAKTVGKIPELLTKTIEFLQENGFIFKALSP